MPDVTVLIGALYPAAESHVELRRWLTAAFRGGEVVGMSTAVLSGVCHPWRPDRTAALMIVPVLGPVGQKSTRS